MAFKLGMKVDLFMGHILVVVSMLLTLMHGHGSSAEERMQLCIISTTKQAIKIKLAATVGFFVLHDIYFANVYMACHLVLRIPSPVTCSLPTYILSYPISLLVIIVNATSFVFNM